VLTDRTGAGVGRDEFEQENLPTREATMTSESASTGQTEIPVVTSGQPYLVQKDGSELKIGRKAGETVLWQDETVPVADLPDPAREALEAGQTDSPDLARALEAIVQAFVERGG
jgi:hypothetical protein